MRGLGDRFGPSNSGRCAYVDFEGIFPCIHFPPATLAPFPYSLSYHCFVIEKSSVSFCYSRRDIFAVFYLPFCAFHTRSRRFCKNLRKPTSTHLENPSCKLFDIPFSNSG